MLRPKLIVSEPEKPFIPIARSRQTARLRRWIMMTDRHSLLNIACLNINCSTARENRWDCIWIVSLLLVSFALILPYRHKPPTDWQLSSYPSFLLKPIFERVYWSILYYNGELKIFLFKIHWSAGASSWFEYTVIQLIACLLKVLILI